MANLDIASTGGISNYPKGHPTKDELREGNAMIAKLDYAKIWKPGTIFTEKVVRLDGQKSAGGGGANLQIQINGVNRSPSGGTTLAGVIVAGELRDFGRTDQESDRKEIGAKVREALKKSLEGKVNCAVSLRK